MKETPARETDTIRKFIRERTASDFQRHVPVHVVWEITLACNLKCIHCGSRAGKARPDELSTEECLEVVDHLARLGTREITLIGGEAYLRKDWLEIIQACRSNGIYCGMQSGARNLTQERLEAAVEAGLKGVGVSIDGLEELHDKLRGVPGSYRMAIDALKRANALGLNASVNTQIGAEIMDELPEVMDRIIMAGATHWQIQITVAMGNAVDHDEILLQPYRLIELMPLLHRLQQEGADRDLMMIVGNNIGYFGPYENDWRNYSDNFPHWGGCSAGQTVIGIEADGTVKGCPSLPTIGYSGGKVRDLTVEQIWNQSPEIHFGRMRSIDDLWGFCRSCYYADACRGGCTWTSHSLLGRPGNNPYCHYRVLELAKRGRRERIVKKREAPQASFAIGEFELVEEPIPGWSGNGKRLKPPPSPPPRPPESRRNWRQEGRVPPRLKICRSCDCHVWPSETVCPHCGANIQEAAAVYETEKRRRAELIAEVERLVAQAQKQGASASAQE